MYILLHPPLQVGAERQTRDNLEQKFWYCAANKGLVKRLATWSWLEPSEVGRKPF